MDDLPKDIRESLEFEKTNWAYRSVVNDPFYDAPQEALDAPAGTLLKTDKNVDTTKYFLPPSCALSRFIYQSETLRGTKVPVSGFVIWPYSPRSQPDDGGYPVVAWAHGTSGFDANAPPSHHKNIGQHFLAPYQIALQGYVVVATDYAGLGVKKHPSGQPIVHEYLASPSQAKDVVHSVTAAQVAFPELSMKFVVIGHSQGGGAACLALHERTRRKRRDLPNPYTGHVSRARFHVSRFNPADVLTAKGEKRLDMVHRTSAGVDSSLALLSSPGASRLKPDWKQNTHLQQYLTLTSNGGKAIKGPLLITHSQSNPILNVAVVENAIKRTAELFPASSQIEYASLPHITHVSALPASQRLWMDWIGDRFAGRAVEAKYRSYELSCARPDASQQGDANWYLGSITRPYGARGL